MVPHLNVSPNVCEVINNDDNANTLTYKTRSMLHRWREYHKQWAEEAQPILKDRSVADG